MENRMDTVNHMSMPMPEGRRSMTREDISTLIRESEHTVAAEVMLLEAERQIDQLKERGEVYRRGFNRVRLERNEYRKGLEHLLWVIDKMMCALEDDFVKTVCCVANEVNQQIKRKLKK